LRSEKLRSEKIERRKIEKRKFLKGGRARIRKGIEGLTIGGASSSSESEAGGGVACARGVCKRVRKLKGHIASFAKMVAPVFRRRAAANPQCVSKIRKSE
jgi:hypothetical protein